jgi:hypothetical protein
MRESRLPTRPLRPVHFNALADCLVVHRPPSRTSMDLGKSSGRKVYRVLVARVVVAVAVATAAWAFVRPSGVDAGHVPGRVERRGDEAPRPLYGIPLDQRTRLKLVVAADPPFVLDVDTAKATPLTGVDVADTPTLSVMAVGSSAVISVEHRTPPRLPASEIYVVRRGDTRARLITTGAAVTAAPAAGGEAVWLKSYEDSRHCSLRKIALTGKQLRSRTAIACSTNLIDAGGRPLLLARQSFSDPATGARWPRRPTEYPWISTGRYLLTGDDDRLMLRLIHVTNRRQVSLRYPAPLGWGMDVPAVQRGGGLVALGFSTPALGSNGTQATDVWLFDPASHGLRHLPDMPAIVDLKFSSMAWTGDGRLVFLARTGGRYRVAVWRPGQKRIAARRVQIPNRNSGSDTFVVWASR